MTKKLNYEFIKSEFEKRGFVLLDKEYINCSSKMEYVCSCKRMSKITWDGFKAGIKCMKCKGEKLAKQRAFSQTYVENYFQNHRCKLLVKYKNTHAKMVYICECGRESTTTFQDFKNGARCMKCYRGKNIGENHPNWVYDRESVVFNRNLSKRAGGILRNSLKATGLKKNKRSKAILGYTVDDLKNHLINCPNWENISKGRWSIDHIYPVMAFIHYGIIDMKLINCLSNLQPMDLLDNISKGDKYDRGKFIEWVKEKEKENKRIYLPTRQNTCNY